MNVMGKIVAVEYVSLDGVMEEPAWSGPYFNEELQNFQYENLFESDALLLGRVTYEGFKAAWPSMSDEAGFADRMNGLPKYVATTTLVEPEWNASFIDGDVAEAVTRLRSADNTLLINGSAQLVNYLGGHGLIDEYRLMIYPVLVGGGKRLFDDSGPKGAFTLKEGRTTDSGVAILTYVPAV
jgi:dihydrofolate reductase